MTRCWWCAPAARSRKRKRIRPYFTIVYLGELTGRQAAEDEEAYAAEREDMEGLAVVQYDGIQQPASSPEVSLVNIVIANGGFETEYASEAVDLIADLAAEDPKVVGVIGLDQSRSSIKFNSDSGEPTDKTISLMHVEKIPAMQDRPVEVFHCGRAHPNDDPACRKP